MLRLIGTAIILALAACAAPEWSKPGVTQAEYERDQRECLYLATGFAERPDYPSTMPYDYAYVGDAPTYYSQGALILQYQFKCMERRGYVRTQ